MDDLISRQAVLKQLADRIEAAKKWHEDCVAFENETGEQASYRALMDFNEVRLMVENLPSAQAEPLIINIDNELTEEEYKKLKQEIADLPVVLLPSAQPEPRWIPVEKGLPKPNEKDEDGIQRYYLIQNEFGDMMVAAYRERLGATWWEQMYQYRPIEDNVIAYMPLPKPYERSEDE